MGARAEEWWVEGSPEGAVLTLRVVPRASKTGFAAAAGKGGKGVKRGEGGEGGEGGAGAGGPRLRLAAPPVDGEANAELVRYLARLFGVAKSDVEILAGRRGRSKRVLVRGVAAAEARRVIESALR